MNERLELAADRLLLGVEPEDPGAVCVQQREPQGRRAVIAPAAVAARERRQPRSDRSCVRQLLAQLQRQLAEPDRTIGGFARFNGSAPLPASTAEGPGEPVRHRYNPGGNRRINAILHRMAVTQLRCEPRAKTIHANARANHHTKKEARRILKRHLSDVIYRCMIRDLQTQLADQPPLAA